ncbi:MAG: SPASM domain-containing protein [Magnetococcales bacterium]|nr:SPASM domain-containing protein [Magnetococcales bacterium]
MARAVDLLRRRPRGWDSLMINTALALARVPGPLRLPVHVTIEPVNTCNARCPICETGNASLERRRGLLEVEAYRAFIDHIAPHANSLMFYFMGEPFLHPRACDMIRHARDRGLFVETCTNGDLVDPLAVLESDVNRISFQIGGMTQASHGVYRVGSRLERVMGNLEALLEARRRRPDSQVQVEVGLIVMAQNEAEIPRFQAWAKAIGVDRAHLVQPAVRTLEEARVYLPRDPGHWPYDPQALQRGQLRPRVVPHNRCTWLWNSVVVNWNGDLVPCCRDPHGRHVMGNVFAQPLAEIWNGPRLTAFRRQVATAQAGVDICRLCAGFGVPHLQSIHRGSRNATSIGGGWREAAPIPQSQQQAPPTP